MCHQNACPCVTVEEDIAAEECLLVYCKPVELYNILQRRAQYNPSFLPRCLIYKIEAKSKPRPINGNVIFNYRDQNNLLRKTEVTRLFSCPFCLMRCGSFKGNFARRVLELYNKPYFYKLKLVKWFLGIRCHLISSHDLFNCEFWMTEEYKAINVSVKTDSLHSESNADEIDPRLQPFSFCSRPRKRKRPEDPLEKGKYVYPHVLESALPAMADERNEGGKDHSLNPMVKNPRTGEYYYSHENGNGNGVDYATASGNLEFPVARVQSLEDIDCIQSTSADKNISVTLPPAAKSRKLSSERTEPRSTTLLQKRQFYHSHRAQPMTLEQVLSDRDSEDEVDDDIADLEDRRMLDDFVDVTKDEKHLMHLWNSFVRKQKVLADGHVPWACEAFLKLHGKMLVQSPTLFWCWRLFMIKLWNHGLLDASTMNNCNVILEQHKDEASIDEKTPKQQQM